MDIGQITKNKIKERKTTQNEIAEKTGAKRQSNISMYIKSGNNIKVCNAVELLNALQCDLIVSDRLTGENINVTLAPGTTAGDGATARE